MKAKNRLPQDKISLIGFCTGIASEHLWDREVVCDYLVHKLWTLLEYFQDPEEVTGLGAQAAAREIAIMTDALVRAKGQGMDRHLSVDLSGIAGFVEWTKEELFMSIVRQVLQWERSFEPMFEGKYVLAEARENMRQVCNLAGIIFGHDCAEGNVVEQEGTIVPGLVHSWRHEPPKPASKKKGAA